MGFEIIGRKNGKKTVSDNSENDVTKITKVLEFLTEAEPSTAIIGSLVRFMWNPGTGTSLCWVQGEVEKRVDPYKQERDAHRCDRVKVLRYTNSLRAFKKLISGLTWSYTHYQDLAPPLSNQKGMDKGVEIQTNKHN